MNIKNTPSVIARMRSTKDAMLSLSFISYFMPEVCFGYIDCDLFPSLHLLGVDSGNQIYQSTTNFVLLVTSLSSDAKQVSDSVKQSTFR